MTRFISPREDVKLLVVSVDDDAYDFQVMGFPGSAEITKGIECYDLYANGIMNTPYRRLWLKEKPEPLGIATELPEEVTRDLVEEVEGFLGSRMFKVVHKTGQISKSNSITFAWHSFLRREGITERSYVLKVKE